MIVLALISIVFFGSVILCIYGLAQLFGSPRRQGDGGTHITYNVHIDRSFNERTENHGIHRKTEAADGGEFSSIINRTNRY